MFAYSAILPRSIRRKVKLYVYFFIYKLEKYHFLSFERCCLSSNNVVNIFWRNFFYAEKDLECTTKYHIVNAKPKRGFVCRIDDAICFSGSDIIITKEHQILYDLRDNYKLKRNKISCRDGIVLLIDDLFLFLLSKIRTEKTIKTGIALCGIFPDNYYHFTFQVLPKFAYIEKIDKEIPILLNYEVSKCANFKQLIDLLNVNHREIIYLNPQTRYKVFNLYALSTQMLSVPHYRPNVKKQNDDDMYCMESLSFLRKSLLQFNDEKFVVPSFVFLSRRSVHRRKFNETECFNIIQPLGFVEILPESLTIAQQIALFNRAKIIIGGSGAAFTNLLYSTSETKCIVLVGHHSNNSIWSSLAAYLNFSLCYVEANREELEDATREHDDFYIEPSVLYSETIKLINDL